MSSLSLSSDASSPANRVVQLYTAVYGQNVSGLTVTSGEKLSLSSATGETTSTLSDILAKLSGYSVDTELLGQIEAGAFSSIESLAPLEAQLVKTTYLNGARDVGVSDLAVYAAVSPVIAGASQAELLKVPSVARHFDLVQNTPLVQRAIASLAGFFKTVKIDVDAVPEVEVKPEVKVKKPAKGGEPGKAEAATTPAAAAATPAAAAAAAATPAAAAAEAAPAKKDVSPEILEQQKKKKEKKEKPKKAPAPPPVAEAPAPWMIDLRVGKIVDVQRHPDADSLYVEKIDIGEAEPRTVVSGLVNYIPIEEMQGKTLITVCNLKPANMRGVKSFAMVLCASQGKGTAEGGVEFVNPPEGSVPGDRVFFEGFADKTALELLNPKKKIFETVQPGLVTLDTKEAAWVNPETKEVHKIVTEKGVCAANKYAGASLS